jgi:hypothetical protein
LAKKISRNKQESTLANKRRRKTEGKLINVLLLRIQCVTERDVRSVVARQSFFHSSPIFCRHFLLRSQSVRPLHVLAARKREKKRCLGQRSEAAAKLWAPLTRTFSRTTKAMCGRVAVSLREDNPTHLVNKMRKFMGQNMLLSESVRVFAAREGNTFWRSLRVMYSLSWAVIFPRV